MSKALLRIDGLRSRYGRNEALHGVDLVVGQGELVAIVGANGAGKTTLLRCISGVQPASAGSVAFGSTDITGASAAARVRSGIGQVPEGRHVFGPMTVEDNLRLGAYSRPSLDLYSDLAAAYSRFPVLQQQRRAPAGTLSGGQQQMLAMARALMARPTLLLLDEPSMGLAPLVIRDVYRAIAELRTAGTTILLVEQNANLALAACDRAYVMEIGRVVLTGTGTELISNPKVRAAYLGV